MSTYWLTNPLLNPLTLPLALLLVTLFGAAALALQAVHLWRGRQLDVEAGKRASTVPERILWQRYRTWAIIALLFTGAVLSGPLTIAVLCAFLCWQGGREYALLTGLPKRHRLIVLLAGWATLLAVLCWHAPALVIAPVLAFFGWSLLVLRPIEGEVEIGQRFTAGLAAFWGYLYLGWLPAFLVALSMQGPGFVLLVGLGVALSDVAAFCTGKFLGGPQLAPQLSPRKTWGGLVGNILGAALAVLLTTLALPGLPFWQRGLLVAAIGLGSAWGDLLESLLKRQRGVKDAGALLPGFGGLLDRIDSLLLVAPLIYYVTRFSFS